MKNLLLSVSLVLSLSMPTFAASVKQIPAPKPVNEKKTEVKINPIYSIGYIDIDKILANYSKYQDFQANQKVALADLNAYIANAQKEINEGKSLREKKSLADKYSTEIQYRKDAFKAKYSPQMNIFINDIKLAIKNVANRKKMFAVFKNDNLFFGGIDITKDVISELNK